MSSVTRSVNLFHFYIIFDIYVTTKFKRYSRRNTDTVWTSTNINKFEYTQILLHFQSVIVGVCGNL